MRLSCFSVSLATPTCMSLPCACVCVCFAQDPSFLKRMSEWRFADGSRINARRAHDQFHNLRPVLLALRDHLQAPNCTAVVDWVWDEPDMTPFADIFPSMPHIRVILNNYLPFLRGAFLTMALDMGPSLHGVCVDKLQLESSQHASAPMHWDVLEVMYLDLGQIVRLPCIHKQCTVRVETLVLSINAILEVRLCTMTCAELCMGLPWLAHARMLVDAWGYSCLHSLHGTFSMP